MSQTGMSCRDPLLDATQRHDEGPPFTEVTEPLNSLERSSEQLEWDRRAGLKVLNCNQSIEIPFLRSAERG
jgi:hypothetical protein